MSRQRGQSLLACRTRPYPHARNRRAPWDTQTSAVVASPPDLPERARSRSERSASPDARTKGAQVPPDRALPTRHTRSAFCSSRSIPRSMPRTRASSPPSTIPASPMSRTSRTLATTRTPARPSRRRSRTTVAISSSPSQRPRHRPPWRQRATSPSSAPRSPISPHPASSIRTTPRAATSPAPRT